MIDAALPRNTKWHSAVKCIDVGHTVHRPHAADRPSTRLVEPSTVPGCVEGGGQPVLSSELEQCFDDDDDDRPKPRT